MKILLVSVHQWRRWSGSAHGMALRASFLDTLAGSSFSRPDPILQLLQGPHVLHRDGVVRCPSRLQGTLSSFPLSPLFPSLLLCLSFHPINSSGICLETTLVNLSFGRMTFVALTMRSMDLRVGAK